MLTPGNTLRFRRQYLTKFFAEFPSGYREDTSTDTYKITFPIEASRVHCTSRESRPQLCRTLRTLPASVLPMLRASSVRFAVETGWPTQHRFAGPCHSTKKLNLGVSFTKSGDASWPAIFRDRDVACYFSAGQINAHLYGGNSCQDSVKRLLLFSGFPQLGHFKITRSQPGVSTR